MLLCCVAKVFQLYRSQHYLAHKTTGVHHSKCAGVCGPTSIPQFHGFFLLLLLLLLLTLQVEQLVSQLASAMPNLLGVVANKNGKRPRERSAPPAATAAAADGQTPPPPPPIATVTVPPPPPPTTTSEGSDRQEGAAVEGTNAEGSQGEGGRKSRRTTPIRGMAAVA